MPAGFIYILENESMPGILKIGMTSRTPMERASELFTTGVPTPFEVVFAMYANDIESAESRVHYELSELRVSEGREFFEVDICRAIEAVFDACNETDQTVVMADLALDPGNLHRYASTCQMPLPDVLFVIDHFTDEEWMVATERVRERYRRVAAERQARISGNIVNG